MMEAIKIDRRPAAGSNAPGVIGLQAEADDELVGLVAQGHPAAYSVLVARHVDRFVAFAERFLGNRADAEDVVQMAYTKLWHNAAAFNPERARFKTWFYRVVRNQCIDYRRTRRVEQLPENYDAVDDSPEASVNIAAKQRAEVVRSALDTLTTQQRSAITLCYFEEMSNREAAEIMELNIKALESLLTRARKRLANTLGKEGRNHLHLV